MADQDGGIMQKILTMSLPPNTNTSTKQRRSKQPRDQTSASKPSPNIDNRPYCEACGDGGELLCCERCPSSFHFCCCDPPLDPLHLPEGEWVCQGCRPLPAHLEEHPNALFKPLLIQCCSENPSVFSLPDDMLNVVIPKDLKHERKLKQQQETTIVKFCYACNRSSRFGKIISCDFCPLSYHMDCLTPPLPDKPISSSWMCPNHVEHRITGLHDKRLTTRIEALQKCRTEISRHSIKMDFIKTLNKIPHYQRNMSRSNRYTSNVPMAIKDMYSSPLSDTNHTPCLSDLLMTATEELEVLRKGEIKRQKISNRTISPPLSPTTSHERDQWTRHAIVTRMSHDNHMTDRSTVDDLMDILDTPLMCNGESVAKVKNGFVQTTSDKYVPDVSMLDNDLVKLLAQQRIEQLFQERNKQPHDNTTKTATQITSRHNQNKHSTSLGILCPVSSYGPAHLLNKRIITIGSSSDMDVSLTDYGHCNYVSAHHACLILDKNTSDNELINYSEHGSIVDGVLYSCDFSYKATPTDSSPVLLLDDITVRGTGARAERARKRLDAARKCLQDKTQASKALSAAYKLSKSVVKDVVIDSSTLANVGIKRRRSVDECSPLSNSPTSSIVSIPLSKTKKTSNDDDKKSPIASNKKADSSSVTPDKPQHQHSNFKPCFCKRSASSLIGTSGKGWEGAAAVSHGSKLRFGCIQLVLSISDKPGYNELLHALKQHNLL